MTRGKKLSKMIDKNEFRIVYGEAVDTSVHESTAESALREALTPYAGKCWVRIEYRECGQPNAQWRTIGK